MKTFIFPALLAITGTGGGIGAGLLLKPNADQETQPTDSCVDTGTETTVAITEPLPDPGGARDYARLNNQFVIPIVEEGRVAALVVLSLSVEVLPGTTERIFAAEPKLRDGFLQNMFDHANIGGFSGNFTQVSNMRILRNDMLQTARRIIGPEVTNILITDIVRQDS